MNLTRTLLLATGLAVVATLTLGPGLHAQGGPPHRPFGPGRPGGPGGPGGIGLPLGQLDLTDTQRSRVKDIMQRTRPDMEALGTRLRAARLAQLKAIEAVPVNEGLVRSASDALGQVEADMAVLRAHVRAEVFALLTPEQQTKATEIAGKREARMTEMRQRMKDRQGRRPGPPPQN